MDSNAGIVKALEQIAKILTGIALKDLAEGDQVQKIARLKACGLQNAEIARMLGTTPNTVNVTVHSLKHKKNKPSKLSKTKVRKVKPR